MKYYDVLLRKTYSQLAELVARALGHVTSQRFLILWSQFTTKIYKNFSRKTPFFRQFRAELPKNI